MRKKISLILLALCLILSSGLKAEASDAGYYFERFDVDARVKKNAVVEVTEHVTVNYRYPRHGFVQEIPLKYTVNRDINGHEKRFVMHSKVENITVEGAPFKVGRQDGYRTIKIGDPDETITGEKSYTVKYTLDMGDDKVKEFDEFFYSLIGAEWDTYMKNVNFKVTFEKPADLSNFHVYAGAPGEKNETGVTWKVAGNTVSGTVKDGLKDGEALTAFTRFPEGYFEGARWDISYMAVVALILLGVVTILTVKMTVKRSGKKINIVKQIEVRPPEGISSAEVGYIIDESADDKDLISLIIYFAKKGYLSIEETGKEEFSLHKIKDIPSNTPVYQKEVFKGLFKNSDTYVDSKTDRKQLSNALDKAKHALAGHFTGDRALRDDGIMVRKILYIIAEGAIFVLLGKAMDFSLMGSVISAGILIFLNLVTLNFLKNREFVGRIRLGIKIFLLAVMFALIFGALTYISSYPMFMGAGLLLIVLNLILLIRVPDQSQYRGEMAGKLLGFKDFIEKADVERINRLVEENPSYFYDVLPYAYVFNLTDKWIKQFEGIAVQQPSWYSGYDNTPASTYMMWYGMNKCMNGISSGVNVYRTKVAMANIHSSTSSSGGGYSGGGAGGGGGHSW